MADEDKDQKTEHATGRRVSQALDEGQIPLSREVATWFGLVCGVIALIALGNGLRDALVSLTVTAGRTLADPDPNRLKPLIADVMRLGLTVSAAAVLGGAAAFLVQTRGQVWPNMLFKGFDSLVELSRLKHVFSREVLEDLGFSLVKVVTVGWAAWSGIKGEFLTLPALIHARPDAQLSMLLHPLVAGSVKVLAALAFLAGLDFALVRYRHRKALMMTKEEVKREHKDEEGDPQIRGRRRSKHRELLKNLIRVEVPRADALIVNPTHIAIAIRYRPGEDKAPKVVAKGKGDLAEMMRDLAREHGIPIVEDIPLARLLFRKVKVGRVVPAETYRAVAAVLAFVYRVTGRRPDAAAPAKRSAAAREVRP